MKKTEKKIQKFVKYTYIYIYIYLEDVVYWHSAVREPMNENSLQQSFGIMQRPTHTCHSMTDIQPHHQPFPNVTVNWVSQLCDFRAECFADRMTFLTQNQQS